MPCDYVGFTLKLPVGFFDRNPLDVPHQPDVEPITAGTASGPRSLTRRLGTGVVLCYLDAIRPK
jgi:hypothetical protein